MVGNIFSTYLPQWLTFTSGKTAQAQVFADMSQWAGYARILRREGLPFQALDSIAGNRSTVFPKWLANPTPGPYWDATSPTPARYARMNQPILTITGHYDGDQLGTLTHYRAFRQHATPAARQNIYLVIGPWDHGGTRVPTAEVNGVTFGPASLLNIHQLHKNWYDWTLRGSGSRPEFLKNRVAYYVAGANGDVWRYADSLEAVATETKKLYLNSAGGRLDPSAPLRSDPDVYSYNPLDPPADGNVTHPSALSFVDQGRVLNTRGNGVIAGAAGRAPALPVHQFQLVCPPDRAGQPAPAIFPLPQRHRARAEPQRRRRGGEGNQEGRPNRAGHGFPRPGPPERARGPDSTLGNFPGRQKPMRTVPTLFVLSLSVQPLMAQVTSPATRSGRSTVYAPRAATVPGALAGWDALLTKYGTKTLGEVLAPAIRLAEEGFPVSPVIAQDWATEVEKLSQDPGARAAYLIDGRRAPGPGEWFQNPDQARTFRRIAEGGIGVFYGGDLGREFVTGLQKLGGYLTLEDLGAMIPRWVEPLSVNYKGYTLHELPPAGQGVAALQMLKMLETIDLKSMGHNSARYLHTLIEAKKLAHADLARYVADPDYMTVKPAALLDSGYLAKRAGLIDPRKAADRPAPGDIATASETVYLTVADAEGNMVSFINSIYSYFGSGVVIPGTGIVLQNRGAGFVMTEGHPNRLAPNKRPLHTIIPAFVTRQGQPWLSFGVMGGDMQPQGHVQVFLNLVEFGMDPQEAIDAPRFRHLAGLTVSIENLPEAIARELTTMGHQLRDPKGIAFGGGQAIMKLARGWAAASDPRKDGMAAGR